MQSTSQTLKTCLVLSQLKHILGEKVYNLLDYYYDYLLRGRAGVQIHKSYFIYSLKNLKFNIECYISILKNFKIEGGWYSFSFK